MSLMVMLFICRLTAVQLAVESLYAFLSDAIPLSDTKVSLKFVRFVLCLLSISDNDFPLNFNRYDR